jgi:hypothetical protein
MQVNVGFYLVWNWLEVVILVVMSYWIRNVRDELNISKELFTTIFFWTLFSSIYIGTAFFYINIDDNNVRSEMPTKYQVATQTFI